LASCSGASAWTGEGWAEGDHTRYSQVMSYITVDLIEGEVYEVDAATVGQYTGVDKGDKKAFEGMGVKYDASHGHIVYGVIKFGIIPTDFGNNGQHVGFYIEWQNDGANMWNNWWRHDLAFWLSERETELIDEPIPFDNEG
jgi:hypothetical protein